MTSDAHGTCPESKSFPDNIEFLLHLWSRERLQYLLSDEARERYVAEAGLSRDKAEALHVGLTQLKRGLAMEDEAMLRQEQLDRERFLREFPQVKQDLEERIGKLHALADKVDKVHRDCTISNVVANSTGAVSGILTIVGLSLAPMTAGASLVLLATGIGLGMAAAVTSVSTSIVEHSNSSSAKAKASHLVSIDRNKEKVVMEFLQHSTPQIVSLTSTSIESVQGIMKNVNALKLAKAKPLLEAEAKCLMTGGALSVISTKEVQKAFGGTVLAMTKSAKLVGMATAGVGLLVDVVSLVKSSTHLHEGAKAESAEELRQLAQELEKKLETLNRIHEHLQEGLTL
ncbi:apolipoprotein L2-like isoform 1-T6 [Hipposideros larvatus]